MAFSLPKESQGNMSAEDGKVDSKLMFSDHAVSLEPVVKERYKEKIISYRDRSISHSVAETSARMFASC